MRFLRFFFMLFALSGVVFSTPASAQDKVAARSGGHDGYSRIVFEWPAQPSYSVSKENNRVLIRFAKAAALDKAGIAADKNVKGVDVLSGPGEPLQVAVNIPAGSRFRDFIVENKLILDVYDSTQAQPVPEPAPATPVKDKPATTEAAEKPQSVKEAAKEEPKAESKPEEKPVETPKGDFSKQKAEDAKAAPIGSVEAANVPAPAIEPHVITLTTVTSVGMAAYQRNGSLWIVIDSADLQSAPQVAGPQKEQFGAMTKFDVPNGAGYKLDIPEGLHVYSEGGNLSWRIIVTPKAREIKPVLSAVADSKLSWPLKNMRKALSYTDPIVGDKITAVTATDAGQFTGSARDFVNLTTLDSVIGLAYVAKSDDVAAELVPGQVSVGRPGGLALSSSKDMQPEQIRQAMEEEKPREEKPSEAEPEENKNEKSEGEEKPADAKEDLKLTEAPPEAATAETSHAEDEPAGATKEELAKVADQKPSGNNIYNFPKWEMGGIHALENNQHVLMVEVANKPKEAQTEDVITMAKLLLANNRGQEALGMLRIALLQVPELEDSAEFQSLRAAALALSGKYDGAIDDFSRDALKNYDDIKYWRAYTLGGLEDWKQAGDVLPSDMKPIAEYPAEIRTPMALMFAEIALRNGRVQLAQQILDILKPDLPKLPIWYASSWNYLTGEAERQAGDAEKATEYWEPLVKNGKDDLFRAKAGLSLTKLQIDQKKIKPDEAIDRLEGLRYAWRGDELETLINYRLGQIYIDRKDYLKGLTVLRNATTLTPGLQVGQDVKNYMTKTFRDIFMNDRLKTVDPLEAIGIYEEFKDLTPPGDEGNKFVDKLAERLVDADLLGRAASLLEYQVNNRLQGDKKAEVAIRLAAIRLLDGNPDGALRSLEIAQDTLNKIEAGVYSGPTRAAPKPEDVAPQAGETAKPEEAKPAAAGEAATIKETVDPEKQRQVLLLKARALSMKKKPDEAIAILEGMTMDPDVNKLRTDIAWGAGKWEEAAMSLNDLIIAEDISGKSPLTEYQRDIILNRAIALNLSGNRVALANLRERYNAQMKDTTKGQMFEIVTRARRPDMIGSREAIESMISEIDLFKGFLDGYGKMDDDKKSGVKEPAALKEPVPADASAAKDNKTESAAASKENAEKTAE